ncbi:hypothetical protein LOZ12_000146 [Ophidiomyces ophidiicola]|uniref:Uncharacterized protein n=1 Tax=Ophidiomyces ophidiicola TaxID=1387563 RepID=A0ACB8V5G0_9EURO|nr:uncharacterized protein LOZ57_003069 [Ophidiomyces ophidiicola]KAI1908903.1 hypothetical protein LOZ61_005316 [Ophidiomyces ophidiicola]KAI1923687.1 hypothetical protein LOZ64_000946 [Ophidiomyces ophidiicola]KAI1923891.1 hypothetical protein LOZ60_004962 [Ophidiomyces ophidiicola]KAI1947917.1 hypothetical protein LOZ57_003069 [Ophidiomyces ophidiicola]KAI1956061.1 hypothetical protein LOZ62_000053 [Ophidiomyces ophidiicola]
MASSKGDLSGSLSQLEEHERTLVELAADDPRDKAPLGEKELELLALYDRIYEQQLEEALLQQDPVDVSTVEDVDAALAKAERELLEARATHSVQRKAIEYVLMTEPSIHSIYGTHTSPVESALLSLINRRDILSLAYENLAHAIASCSESLSNAEVENIQATKKNRELVQSLLQLTSSEKNEKPEIKDPKLKKQFEALVKENKNKRAENVTVKRIVSAAIAASGIDWASDEDLLNLVMDDESADEL